MNDFHFEERPYQTTAVQEVLAEFAAGRKSVLLESPVGSGKTVMGLMIIREMQANSRTPLTTARRCCQWSMPVKCWIKRPAQPWCWITAPLPAP